MTIKERLIQEIESTEEALLAEALDFLQFLKSKTVQTATNSEVGTMTQAKAQKDSTEATQSPYRPASGRSLLRHAGKWAGNDLKECLELVRATRGKAKFHYDNLFD